MKRLGFTLRRHGCWRAFVSPSRPFGRLRIEEIDIDGSYCTLLDQFRVDPCFQTSATGGLQLFGEVIKANRAAIRTRVGQEEILPPRDELPKVEVRLGCHRLVPPSLLELRVVAENKKAKD